MKPLLYVPLDEAASNAIDMAQISSKSEKMNHPIDLSQIDGGRMPVFVATVGDEALLKRAAAYKERAFLLFPEPEEGKSMPKELLKSRLIFIPVRLESLASLSYSQTIKSLEQLCYDSAPDDFNLGSEHYFQEMPTGLFHRFYHAEGRHLKEAVLRMAHTVRSIRIKKGAAYTLHLPANTALFALDEAIDVLEIAVPPDKPIFFAVRFDKRLQSAVRVSALVATPDIPASDLQRRIDGQRSYLGKLAVIVEAFAFRQIDENEMVDLCRDNGLDPDDADRFYDLIYARSDETADLIRKLRTAPLAGDREELIAQKLAEGFIDVRILEELAGLFALDADAILKRAEEIGKKSRV